MHVPQTSVESAFDPPTAPVRDAHGSVRVPGVQGAGSQAASGLDSLLDALMRLVARHFGVAAACVLPGDAAAGAQAWAGAGVVEASGVATSGAAASGVAMPLREALAEIRSAQNALAMNGPGDTDESHVISGAGEPFIVSDLGNDPAWQACLSRASALPFRFVAAWPLRGAGAEQLGSLCLLDHAPRELAPVERASLDDFARVIAALAAQESIIEAQRAPSPAEAMLLEELESLRARERLLALAIAGSGTGIWDRDVVTGEIRYSTGWKAMLGYAADEVSNRIEDSYQRLHPDDLDYVKATMQAHFEGRTEQYEVEHRIRCKDGSYKWICSRGKVTARDDAGRALRMIGTTTDVTSMHQMAERLRESASLVTNLTNEVPGLVFQCRRTPNGHMSLPYASAGIAEIYELEPAQVAAHARAIEALIHPDDLEAYRASFAASAATLAPWHLEYRVCLPRQGLRWRQGDAKPQRLADGVIVWHGFITDVTERKCIEAELQEFATTDGLTGLANRRHFMMRLEAQLALLRHADSVGNPGHVGHASAAVLMCDLDHFKSINDRFGHAVGDEALRHFAAILRTHLRAGDVAGRIGGEEFALLLGGADLDGACTVARRIQDCIARAPLAAGAGGVPLTVSIGVTQMRAGDPSVEAALSRSDSALYRAKKGGRNRIEFA
ncbi:sensor domain-containing diguanylate cyclase [Paraburkholderia sacchari]|uniref:sensor domain-containing diguanylate cyclase n=1 Tax=Paraburkholderia sacchari TaxID=159450 RepID=UPI001FD43AB0|nr:sensor domain-containing diguanylate cyclase [Paraburkholderia sacchari]